MARFQAQVGCFEKDLSQEESTISPGSNALKHCVGSSDGAGANWVTTLRKDHICKLTSVQMEQTRSTTLYLPSRMSSR